MKFLICGFGNIGQRHFRNLKTLLPDCKIDICSSPRHFHRIFDNKLNIAVCKNNLREYYNFNNFYFYHQLEDAIELNSYTAVFICSLPPKRIDIAIKCAKKNINLFIEKPLSNNLNRVYELQDIVEENKLKCALGFQMRFSPVIEEIKKMVDDDIFGDIYRIEVNHCNNIHNWTKDRDLKDFYALKEKCGGGVLLSQIHEIDYLTYIFGKHYPISAIYGNWLNKGEVEDNITVLSNLEKNYCIPIIINLDFISTILRRDITIYGLQKTQNFDLMPINSEQWNDFFIHEMEAFLNLLEDKKDSRLATLEDGMSSLEYCMDIKNHFMKVNI